ncbi:hypothetical protein B0I35DRAFT_517395 [Stachybotrys elegans]|uniref:Secreted protein n=1 Tax=Stachybotrys elegans TaxID=80388 RepID=A0A8K0WJB4_9HYPO|nr:hypothetical protein B0I35DRAFT_517395 [Stachybotrys elegans]
MRIAATFLALVAGVAALDVWLNWFDNKCRDANSVRCKSLAPNVCCTVSRAHRRRGNPFSSIEFRDVPRAWKIEARGYRGDDCRMRQDTRAMRGSLKLCLDHGAFSGAGYGFLAERAVGAEGCSSSVRPSILSFSDGPQYNITDLDDDLLDVAALGGRSMDVPQKFDANRIDEAL